MPKNQYPFAGIKWATDDNDEDGGRRGRRTERSSTV